MQDMCNSNTLVCFKFPSSHNIPSCLPSFSCASTLSASFLKFFNDKISLLCSKLPPPAISPTDQAPITPPLLLSSFAPSTEEEVRGVIMFSSDSSCDLDIIPTNLLKSCVDVIIKPLTIIVNLSLSEGSFPTTFKHALVKPLLKKHNLPQDELSSYRPISNLNFISKILERIIHARISSHLESFPSITPFQFAYRQFHSTETAFRIQKDLLLAINKLKVSALVLLDLSAAFDTIDHKILLSRLSSFYGLSNTALNLTASYLLDRTQSVSLQSHSTPPSNIFTVIPQGSVLDPLLFSLYTSPVSQIFIKASISYHLCADDTQIYIPFSPNQSYDSISLLSSTLRLDEVHAWLTSNRLSVNSSKTEFLKIGNPQQRNKIYPIRNEPQIVFLSCTYRLELS